MKIGIMSDIHDNITNLLKALAVFKRERVTQVFFCGDLNSHFTVDYFEDFKIPVRAIFGNNEGDKIGILRTITEKKLDFQYASKQGLMWDLSLDGKRIGVYHGHQKEILENLLDSDNFDIFLSGHNHIYQIKKIKKTLWINPGCVCGFAGLDINPVKPTVAILDLNNQGAKIIHL
jgi:putative phosphoesterase